MSGGPVVRAAWSVPCAAATAALALVLSCAPAGAVERAPAPAPSGLPPTAAQLQEQARQQAGALASSESARAAADAAAATALEGYQLARRQAEQALRTAQAQAAALGEAQRATAAARERLSRYLGSMYRNGLGNSRLTAITSLVDAPDPGRLFGGLGLASRVGEAQDDAVLGLAGAEAAQVVAAEKARLAGIAARAATVRADAARRTSDAAVAEAARRVELARTALAFTEQAFAQASAREALTARAEVIARQRSGIPAAAIDGAFALRPVGTCAGSSLVGYANGAIPLSALCPLWGTSGEVLRADAASAFDAMSHSYAEVFGAPVCVTDSYRDYASQVAVAAAKPTLAATPGSSNHGWGVAVDLCDGIQSFTSPQHRWMIENATAFGWFHPSWAQAGGSKPEPWHWEFAG